MSKTVKLTLFLGIVAAICTGLLASVNMITYPTIDNNNKQAQNKALAKLYADAKDFKEIELKDQPASVKQAFMVDDNAYVFKVVKDGFANPIEFLIGFDKDGKNSKYLVLVVNDTKGFGSRVADEEFTNMMSNKSVSDSFDTLSGATVSSSAVVAGIKDAIEVFSKVANVKVEAAPQNAANGSDKKLDNKAKIIEQKSVDKGLLFIVESSGLSANNKFEILVSADKKVIKSVKLLESKDTPDMLNMLKAAKYEQSFNDLSVDKVKDKNDVVSGASISSNSYINAVKIVAASLK